VERRRRLNAGRSAASAPKAMANPASGKLETTPAGILSAQVAHTRTLGDKHAFHAAQPGLDPAHGAEVEAQVAAYADANSSLCDSREVPKCMNAEITEEEIARALRKLKNGKAPSPTTAIPNELLKYGGASMARLLQPLLQRVWVTGQLPGQWRKRVIQYFHKSGSETDMANYRGITLLDTISKLFKRVLADRLLAYAEETNMLHEAQNAFRRGRSTDQHIYTLSQVLRGRLRQGKATYAFFLDLKKAYDTVWRDGLLYKPLEPGHPGQGVAVHPQHVRHHNQGGAVRPAHVRVVWH
jgi:hypothetical protein